MLNEVTLIGRLTKEQTPMMCTTGTEVVTFSLAVDRPFKNKDGERDCDFITCVAYGRTAEIVCTYGRKGEPMAVCGRIQNRSYEKDGEKRYVTEVIAERVVLLGRKPTENQAEEA